MTVEQRDLNFKSLIINHCEDIEFQISYDHYQVISIIHRHQHYKSSNQHYKSTHHI